MSLPTFPDSSSKHQAFSLQPIVGVIGSDFDHIMLTSHSSFPQFVLFWMISTGRNIAVWPSLTFAVKKGRSLNTSDGSDYAKDHFKNKNRWYFITLIIMSIPCHLLAIYLIISCEVLIILTTNHQCLTGGIRKCENWRCLTASGISDES